MEETMETGKGEELVQSMMRRDITSLDDEELWADFETEGIDRILSGEIKPKTLITHHSVLRNPLIHERARAALIAKEMLSVFPNSRYVKWKWGIRNSLRELIGIAKERGCTSLVLARTRCSGYDEIRIVSLLSGAAAQFRVLNLIPREHIPDQASPPIRLYPKVDMQNFTSPASVGAARLVQSLFPKINRASPRNLAFFHNKDGFIHYRHYCYHSEEADLAGERPRRLTRKECGPRFSLMLTGVSKITLDSGSLASFDRGHDELICSAASDSRLASRLLP